MGALALTLVRKRASLWAIAAILAAVLTGLTVYSYLSWIRAQVPVAGKLISIVVAARDIEAGEQLGGGNLTLQPYPEKYLPPLAIRSTESVTGKVSAIPIYKGEAVTQRKVGLKGGLSAIVPPGMRAYSLRPESGGGLVAMLKPGDRVDVIVTFGQEVFGEATSITILRSREVASIASSGGQAPDKVTARLHVDQSLGSAGITLYVTSEEAQRLAMAESLGKITLIMAPANSETDKAPAPISPRDLTSR